MESQQEETCPELDRPSFFRLSPNMRAWAQAGPLFWAGLILGFCVGIGLGLWIGAGLVTEGVITFQNNGWLIVTALVLEFIGIMFAWQIVRRKEKP